VTAARKDQKLVVSLSRGSGIPGLREKGARVIVRQLRLQQLQFYAPMPMIFLLPVLT